MKKCVTEVRGVRPRRIRQRLSGGQCAYGIEELVKEYKKRRADIQERLRYFEGVWAKSDKHIFSELCFCLLTPQSKAVNCDKAIAGLKKSGVLFNGFQSDIVKHLKSLVRFHNNKAKYISEARELFTDRKSIRIKKHIRAEDTVATRDWLVKNVKGLGYKEASHFLRNIGHGRNVAIIDRHILKNLQKYGVIDSVPRTISKNIYLEIEDKMRKFSKVTKIPIEDMDLLFWSAQTGFVFK